MGLVCLIPLALYVFIRINQLFRFGLITLGFLPAINIGLLLALESPLIYWQQLTGVSVSVRTDEEEVNQAYTFLGELRSRDKERNCLFVF